MLHRSRPDQPKGRSSDGSLLALGSEGRKGDELANPAPRAIDQQAGARDDRVAVVSCQASVPKLPTDAAGRLFTPLWARQALGLSAGLSLTSARNAFLRHRGRATKAFHLPGTIDPDRELGESLLLRLLVDADERVADAMRAVELHG